MDGVEASVEEVLVVGDVLRGLEADLGDVGAEAVKGERDETTSFRARPAGSVLRLGVGPGVEIGRVGQGRVGDARRDRGQGRFEVLAAQD